jgi:hypothetical protein
MGYGAQMSVTSNRTEALRTFITDVNCMYDNGDEGSDLSVFNNAVINSKSTLGPQYIEAKGSGSCFFESSNFSLQVTEDSDGSIIGIVVFQDSDENWAVASNENPGVVNAYVNNSAGQAEINVVVASS